ncbi:MAG: RluA family pseudouridine synthase [Firmicutes bacterium]|nr:RluA family pseudouridine synthase [Bacillota bacterium]
MNQQPSPQQIQINNENIGKRLDTFLADFFAGEHTRSQISASIKNGDITLNGNIVKTGTILKLDDIIKFSMTCNDIPATPENIPLDIVFEDNHLIIINKPRGMTVHPGAGVKSGTLLNALLYKFKKSDALDRAGIVHRLDKNTAGLIMVAKTKKTQEKLSKMFESHQIQRTYIGLIEGHLHGTGTVNKPIIRDQRNRTRYTVATPNQKNARIAITHYESITLYTTKTSKKPISLVKFNLETGRTHQIRVHMRSLNHPLIADPEYNQNSTIKVSGQLLESIQLEFTHPITSESLLFKIETTPEFNKILSLLDIVK